MTNKKISQLPAAAPLDGTELVPVVQGGVTAKSSAGEQAQATRVRTVAAAGAAQTLDPVVYGAFDLTLSAATCTLTFGAPTAGVAGSFTAVVRQDATGGRLVVWPGSVSWFAGSTPVLKTGPGAVDVVSFISVDGGTTWIGFVPSTVTAASNVSFAPTGSISATDVQSAVAEVDSEKVSKAGDTLSGGLSAVHAGPALAFGAHQTGDTEHRVELNTDGHILFGDGTTQDANLYRSAATQITTNSELVAPDFKAAGISGATQATRYVGGTASGAPVAGTFAVGDFIVARDGKVWVCTVAGTPGTWTAAGGGSETNADWQQHNVVLFNDTQGGYLGNPGYNVPGNSWGFSAAGYEAWAPVFLTPGVYNQIGVLITSGAVSTWRLGIDNTAAGNFKPDTNAVDAGTISTNTGYGVQSVAMSLTVTTAGWFWGRVKCDAYTASPTVALASGVEGVPAISNPGWPISAFNAQRFFTGFIRQNASGTGSLPTAPPITGDPSTGLSYADRVPRFFIRKGS